MSASHVQELLGQPQSQTRDSALTDAVLQLRKDDAVSGVLLAWAVLHESDDPITLRILSFLLAQDCTAENAWIPLLDLLTPPYPHDPATLLNCHTAIQHLRWQSNSSLLKVATELPGFILHSLECNSLVQESACELLAGIIEDDSDLAVFTQFEISALVSRISRLDSLNKMFELPELSDRTYRERHLSTETTLRKELERIQGLARRARPKDKRELLFRAVRYLEERVSIAVLLERVHNPVQEIRLSFPREPGIPSWSIISSVADCFIELFQATARDLLGIRDLPLIPIGGRTGSFVLQFELGIGKREPRHRYNIPFDAIARLLQVASSDGDVSELLATPGPGLIEIARMLRIVRSNGVSVEVNMYSPGSDYEHRYLAFDRERAASLLPRIAPFEYHRLSSADIPQADTLGRVFEIVGHIADDRELTLSLLNVTRRQINYYKQAARILGLLTKEGGLTPAGYNIAKFHGDPTQQLIDTVRHFESSKCGRAWIRWSKAQTLADVSEESALAFLREVAPTLSEDTARRRSKTLETWRHELLPHHYAVSQLSLF